MKNTFKNESFSEKLKDMFTNTALNSSAKCADYLWQQPKAPKCLIDREIKDLNNEK